MTNSTLRSAAAVWCLLLAAGCCCPGAGGSGGGARDVFDDLDAEGSQIFINMRTVRIPADHVTAALGDLCPASATEPRSLSQAQHDALQKAWSDDERVRVVQAPKILALNGQEATLFIGETIRFARTQAATNARGGLEFEIQEGPAFVGYKMAVTPTVKAGDSRVALDLHTVQRTLKPEYTQQQIAAMDQATFLRDAIYEERVDAEFEIERDGHVLIGSPAALEDAEGRYISVSLLSVRVIPDEQAPRTRISQGPPPIPPAPVK
jgi:hypothetical protein